MLHIEPATSALADVVRRVRDDQLTLPTPCAPATVGDLIDHVDSFCMAFAAAARKAPLRSGATAPTPDARRLGPDWRSRIPLRLQNLANAWSDPDAWSGMTEAGGQQMPGDIAGAVALDEVVLHGWDIAVATGQRYSCPDDLLSAAYGFVDRTATENPGGVPGLYGPALQVGEDAPLLDRLVGRAGRDPGWPDRSLTEPAART